MSVNKRKCPICGEWSNVIETRSKSSWETRRRMECQSGHRFSTIEISHEKFVRLLEKERELAEVDNAIGKMIKDMGELV